MNAPFVPDDGSCLQLPPQAPAVINRMLGVERLYRIMGANMMLMADSLRDLEAEVEASG